MKKFICLLLLAFLLIQPALADYNGAEVLRRAQEALGKPYEWGHAGPDAYDCSGLVSYCLTGVHAHVGIPTTFMRYPAVDNPQPGDICVNENICAIYTGGGTAIYAMQPGTVVSYAPVQRGMIYVRPEIPRNDDPPATGDTTPVLPLALCTLASLAALILLLLKKRA